MARRSKAGGVGTMEAEVGGICFKDTGYGYEPWNSGSLRKRENKETDSSLTPPERI